MALCCALMFETRNNSANATIRRERTFGISNKIPVIQVLKKSKMLESERKLSVRVGREGSAATDLCKSVADFNVRFIYSRFSVGRSHSRWRLRYQSQPSTGSSRPSRLPRLLPPLRPAPSELHSQPCRSALRHHC